MLEVICIDRGSTPQAYLPPDAAAPHEQVRHIIVRQAIVEADYRIKRGAVRCGAHAHQAYSARHSRHLQHRVVLLYPSVRTRDAAEQRAGDVQALPLTRRRLQVTVKSEYAIGT